MTRRVLVTRSLPGARSTADAITALGFEPIVEPLIQIEQKAATIPEHGALAFTSVNGVRTYCELSEERSVPVWCVGDRTAQEALNSGFIEVQSAAGNVADLCELLCKTLPRELTLLHAGNEEARGDLVGALREQGFDAAFVAFYRSVEAEEPGPQTRAWLEGTAEIDCVLFHSPKAARVFSGFTKRFGCPERLKAVSISVAAEPTLSSPGAVLHSAEKPNEKALIDALKNVLETK